MKKITLLLVLSLSVAVLSAQSTSKIKAPAEPATSEMKKLLSGTGLPFEMINDSVSVIPYGGENIKSYQVVIQKVSDLYIVYTNLSEDLPGMIDDTKYKYLLQQNNNFDIVKIGLDADDNTVYLRADVYKSSLNTPMLKRIIEQVANVANIIGGDLK